MIAGIDVDEDENGNKVPVTFVTEELYAETAVMNDAETNAGGWKESKMRKTTMPAIEAQLPEHLRNRINTVKKVSLLNDNTEQITYDNVWIPSAQELNNSNYENNGVIYSIYSSNASRLKRKLSNTGTVGNGYWLRTAIFNTSGTTSSFCITEIDGSFDNITAESSIGVAVSFSVGHIPEKVQWKLLADSIEDGTYKDKYSVGDLIPYTMSDGNTYHAQIVAFGDEGGDVDASGNAIPVTFLTKELMADKAKMNDTADNTTGWSGSKMRNTTMPTLRAMLPSYVVGNLIPAKKYSLKKDNTEEISYDEVWIPSQREIGLGYETSGVAYTGVFKNATSRIRMEFNSSSVAYYWTRTAYAATSLFRTVYSNGDSSGGTASYDQGVLLGFCFGSVDKTTTKAPTSTDVSKAYAVEWDYSQSSPALTRKGLASSFADPSPATSVSGSGSSPFDNIWPWAGMEVYNITPEGRKIKKGETGFSFTDNDVMVYIPEFYYTAQKDTTNQKWTWAISPVPLEGYEKHPGSGRFISRYHTSGTYFNAASKSGVVPLTNYTQTQYRDLSKNKGEGWYMLDLASWSALQMLYIVEYANWDSQTMLGKGWNTGSVGSVGGNDSATYHTIKVDGNHNMYRWIEDPFSNVLDWIDGFIGSTSSVYVGIDNASFDGTTGKLTKAGSLKLPSTEYIKGYGYSEESAWAFIPDTSGGSQTTYVPDYVNADSSAYPAAVGGSIYDFANFGFASLYCYSVSVTNNTIGSRLIYIV